METLTETPQQAVVKSINKTPVSIDATKGIYKSNYQKDGTMSVQLRQEITTSADYPGARATSNLNGSIASNSEFGFATKNFANTEKRVAWINIPASWTMDQALAAMAKFPKATLYKILDNRPILSGDQVYAINNGLGEKTMDDYANQQVVRYSDTHATRPGKIILDPNGKVQYRAVFFDQEGLEDQDGRTANPDYGYVTPQIQAELDGVPVNATSVPDQGLES